MIVKAALLLFRGPTTERELMFVRAKGKAHLVFPGGKQDEGETIQGALARELREELQVGVVDVRKLGVVTGATPDGRPLQMHLYNGVISGEPTPSAEIEEIVWFTREAALANQSIMTPMTLQHVAPFLAAKALW
jgi:8-oxo-dGTP pyrophosphatase MutT (NUDIX family)